MYHLLKQIVQGYVAATFASAMTALRLMLTLSCGVASGAGDQSVSILKESRVNEGRQCHERHCRLMPNGSNSKFQVRFRSQETLLKCRKSIAKKKKDFSIID